MPLDEVALERMLGPQWHERLPPICAECGYNLTGLPDNRCPECGYVYNRRDLKRNAQRMLEEIRRLRGVNDITNVGLYLCLSVIAFLGMSRLMELADPSRGWMTALARVLGIFAALPTIGLGLQVFRVRQLPEYARALVPIQPRYGRGAIVVILGLVLVVASLLMP